MDSEQPGCSRYLMALDIVRKFDEERKRERRRETVMIRDMFEWPEDEPHPLLIQDVMKDVLNSLGVQDLEKCRKICRVWNSEACGVLKTKKIVALLDVESVKYYLDKNGDTRDFPHEQFELHMEHLREESGMIRFWTLFGSHIKSLDFRQSSLYLETLFSILSQFTPNLKRLSLKWFPRRVTTAERRNREREEVLLRNIVMPLVVGAVDAGAGAGVNQQQGQGRGSGAGARQAQYALVVARRFQNRQRRLDEHLQVVPPQPRYDLPPPGNWSSSAVKFPSITELNLTWCPQPDNIAFSILKDLLLTMPNLESLFVADVPLSNISIVGQPAPVTCRERIATALAKVLTDDDINLPHLQRLDVPLKVGNAELTKLKGKRLRLISLSLKLNQGTKCLPLKEFLSSISPTLQVLQIEFSVDFFVPGMTFPAFSQMKSEERTMHLKELKELTLSNFWGPVALLSSLTHLRSLTVNGASIDVQAGQKCFGSSSEHQLKAFRTELILSPHALMSLSMHFPFLRAIKMSGINDTGLGVIYRNLPYLEELEILNGNVTDQGLSGVPIAVCKDMAETLTFSFVVPAKFRSDLFLGSLQYLRRFKLIAENVSDISIFFGIIDCQNLESLTLHCGNITDIGLFKIADVISSNSGKSKIQSLDVHLCENVTEEGRFYLKEKLKHIRNLVVDPNFPKKQKLILDNPFRQIGAAGPGRLRSGFKSCLGDLDEALTRPRAIAQAEHEWLAIHNNDNFADVAANIIGMGRGQPMGVEVVEPEAPIVIHDQDELLEEEAEDEELEEEEMDMGVHFPPPPIAPPHELPPLNQAEPPADFFGEHWDDFDLRLLENEVLGGFGLAHMEFDLP